MESIVSQVLLHTSVKFAGGTPQAGQIRETVKTRPTFLESVQCSGSESSLLNCTVSDVGLHECSQEMFATVECPRGMYSTHFRNIVYRKIRWKHLLLSR